jgi:hypothetical protein
MRQIVAWGAHENLPLRGAVVWWHWRPTSSSQVLIKRRCVDNEVVAALGISSELGTARSLSSGACTMAAGGGVTVVAAWSPH